MKDLIRTKWAAVGAAVAVTLGAGGVSLTQAAITSGEKPVYVALDAPCRLVDTRPATQIGTKGTPIGAGDAEAYEIQVTGDSGQCTGALAVPADAAAVALNVTAIAPVATATGRSYFTVYPADATRPGTSNLNFLNGAPPTPNKVDVGLSGDGKIKIYNNEGTAHAAVDVFGYYIDHNHDDRYYTEAEVDATRAAASVDGNQELPITTPALILIGTNPNTTVRSLTIDTDVPGKLIVNASGTAEGDTAGETTVGSCSISTDANIDNDRLQRFSMTDGEHAAISLTRGIDVAAGSHTVNLVCRTNSFLAPGPSVESRTMIVRDTSMTATFLAD